VTEDEEVRAAQLEAQKVFEELRTKYDFRVMTWLASYFRRWEYMRQVEPEEKTK
jgi:hypothetical protein